MNNFILFSTLSLDGSVSEILDLCHDATDSLSESFSLSPAEPVWLNCCCLSVEDDERPIVDVDAGDPSRESTKPLWKPPIFESSILKLIAAKPILFIHLAISSRDEQ